MASMRDVAQRAGVSTATVSRLLQDSASVKPARAAKVWAAIEELGYVPNGVARNLSRRRTGLLGLIVADLMNPFHAELARGVEDVAASRNHHLIIGSSDLDLDRERAYAQVFLTRIVDGVIATPSGRDPHLAAFAARGVPLVLVDRRVDGIAAPSVHVDNHRVAQEAVRGLVGMGHRRIAIITGPLEFETASRRLGGYLAALAEAGIDTDNSLIRSGQLRSDGGRAAMQDLLRLDPRPTATFCFNNFIAVGALQALADAAVPIPAGMSLVTIDDMDLFQLIQPPISAIAQPAYEMGATAARLLLDHLEHGAELDPQAEVVLPVEFRWRASTGPGPMAAAPSKRDRGAPA